MKVYIKALFRFYIFIKLIHMFEILICFYMKRERGYKLLEV